MTEAKSGYHHLKGHAVFKAEVGFGGAATICSEINDTGTSTADGANNLGASDGTCCLGVGSDDLLIGA